MRPKIETLLYMVLRGTWLVVGICLGAVAIILIDSGAELALDRSLAWGIAIGVGLCILAAFILIMLRPKEMDAPPPLPEATTRETRAVIDKLATRLGLSSGESNQLWEVGKQQAKGIASLGLRLWSGAAALGMAAAVAGSVIAMVTAFAAIRQVSRIDAQNALLEAQIFEAQASRAASVFTAQLPSLLAAIDAERAVATSRLTELRGDVAALEAQISEAYLLGKTEAEINALQDSLSKAESVLGDVLRGYEGADPELWVPSDALRARIQSVIDTSEPFLRLPQVDRAVAALNAVADTQNTMLQGDLTDTEFRRQRSAMGWIEPIAPMRFSPQRGQLLRLLMAAKVDLDSVVPPFDFSQSDLSGFSSDPSTSQITPTGLTITQLGRTRLTRSNLVGASLDQVDISQVDLRGSVLNESQQIQFAVTELDPFDVNLDLRIADPTGAIFGTSFSDVILLNEPFSQVLEDIGALGNTYTIVTGEPVHILEAKELELGLSDAQFQMGDLRTHGLLGLHPVAIKAEADDLSVYRLGSHDLLNVIWIHVSQALLGGRANRGSERRAPGDCANMQPFALELVRDMVWYADQPGTHPKWDMVIDLVVSRVPGPDRECFMEWGDTQRKPPELGSAAFLEGTK